jgi:hypothetical protein
MKYEIEERLDRRRAPPLGRRKAVATSSDKPVFSAVETGLGNGLGKPIDVVAR